MKTLTCLVGLAALITSGCSPDECEETEYIPNVQTTLSALTYNTGLGPGLVRYYSPRSPEVIDALADEPFDILCLQEVWQQEESDSITQLFQDQGLYVLRADTRGQGEYGDTCSPGQLDPILECIAQECADWSDEDTSLCALKKCRDPLEDLFATDRSCLTCIASSTGKSVDEIEQVCTTTGASRVQDGGNGVILVSRYPLLNTETLHLPASFANRVAQMARVELPTGPVEIACTHISANQLLPPLQSGFESWIAEKKAQVSIISDRLNERGECMPQIFLGDMNTSRSNGGLVHSSRVVFELAESKGFESPAATWDPPICSSCAENTFHSNDGNSRLIDHVMFRTGDVTKFDAVTVERTLDWTVSIEDQGNQFDSSLSDHFGIRVTFDISTD